MAKQQPSSPLPLLERAIAVFSPRTALERAQYRAALGLVATRSYDIAMQGRRTSGWLTSGTSANAEIGSALVYARNRSRDLVRNNPYASSAVKKLTCKIVGAGITPLLEGGDEKKNKLIAADWNAFSEQCDPQGMMDMYGIQSLVIRTVIESGEALVVYEPQPAKSRLQIPLFVRVLEPDYLDHTKTQTLDNGGAILHGVEFDGMGRRVAYWMFEDHPGNTNGRLSTKITSRRISAQYVDHIFDIQRPGQARGMSWLSAAALKLRDVADYEEAELVRKKIAACFTAFIKQQGTAASLTQQGLTKEEDKRLVEEISPGLMQRLKPGDDVTFAQPTDTAGYVEYLVQQLHAIAAGIGVPYYQLTGDVSQTNYSSLRGAMLDFWDYLDHWQWLMMIPQMCRKSWQRFAAFRVLAKADGGIDPTTIVNWTPPARPFIDPLKDALAEQKMIRMGRKSLRRSIAETGHSPDEVLAEIAASNKKIDDLGLVLDSDPRRITSAGVGQFVDPDPTDIGPGEPAQDPQAQAGNS